MDIAELETTILAPKFLQSNVLDPSSKIAIKWKSALKVMAEAKTDPSEWFSKPFLLYNSLTKSRYSPDHADRLISLLNLYGYFYCTKYKKPFLAVPKLRGKQRVKQYEASRQKPG